MKMETPSSVKRVTRSQALASSGNKSNIPMSKKVEGTEKGAVKSRQKTGNQQDRFVLMDISNDSPIVGLTMGSLETPSSKKRICGTNSGTPGSGETLLRGQVKTLLQKVEEDAEISKISVDVNGPFHYAPTPNNTPHVSNLSGKGSVENNGLESAISQIVTDIFDGQKKEESDESEKDFVTRSLMFDFSDKSESSSDSTSDCTSVLMYQGSKDNEDDFEGEVTSEKEEDDYDEGEEEDYCDDNDAILDDLCEGLSKVSVNGVEFAGKHTRFVYNSDDEGEEDCDEGVNSLAGGVLRLKGLPTPKGKHLRFSMESTDEGFDSPSGGVLRLKGLPTPKGKHLRFPMEDSASDC